jgi:hypothetical protein
MTPCPVCGKPIPPTSRRTYCSAICRKRAELDRRLLRKLGGPGATGPAADLDELMGLLWEAARGGSVAAMGVLLRELRRQEPVEAQDPFSSVIDELAKKRGLHAE